MKGGMDMRLTLGFASDFTASVSMSSSPLTQTSTRDYATFASEPKAKTTPQPSPSAASWISRLLFRYANHTMKIGNERQLNMDDLWELEGENQSAVAFKQFQQQYERHGRSLVRAIVATYGAQIGLCGVASGLTAACNLFAPVVLHHVISAFASPEIDVSDLTRWLGAFFTSRLLIAFLSTQSTFALDVMAIRLLASLKGLLFRKAMSRSLQTRSDVKVVELMNLFTSDMSNIMWLAHEFNSVWILPIQISISVYMLYYVIGWAAFAGLAVIALSMVITFFIGSTIGAAFGAMMHHKDSRMKAVKEVFSAIQIVKLNAWESKFFDKIMKVRSEELRQVARFLYSVSTTIVVMWVVPLLVSTISFAVYALIMKKTLTAAKVFTAIALFNSLRDPLRLLPTFIQETLKATVSIDRMGEYLNLPEVDPTNVTRAHKPNEDGVVVSIENASFRWTNEATIFSNLQLQIKKGDLVVVQGPVGAGKSSLCAALLGEMTKTAGRVFVAGSVAYYAQQPWIQNMSIRDNILFGHPLDERKYQRVLDACGLLPDLKQFPGGDLTEIGQKGVNLSGGQKARVSLARACYSDADIFILDSPLAAVDAVVQSEIFSKCICGFLEDKTVILVTHSPDIIASEAVNVRVMIQDGKVIASEVPKRDPKRSRSSYVKSTKPTMVDGAKDLNELGSSTEGRLIDDEDRKAGRVSLAVFSHYLNALGGFKVCLLLILIQIMWQGFQISSDLWLSHWTGQKDAAYDLKKTTYNMEIYVLLCGGSALMVSARAFAVTIVGLRGARLMFESMTKSLLSAPLRFFDVNPIGRITNRYGDDIASLDTNLPFVFGSFLAVVIIMCCQLATAVYILRILGLFVIPLAYIYVSIGSLYLLPSREISRLLKVASSPVLSHISQSEDGVVTIRAFGQDSVHRILDENFARNDVNNRAWYAETVASQWFKLRMELLGCAIVICIVSSLVYLRGIISPGMVGVAFTYALNIDGRLVNLVDTWAWLEIQMVAPERVFEFSNIPSEGKSNSLTIDPQPEWPTKGTITFDSVVFSYKEGGAPVLKGISFGIRNNEKIGIVGRTGAGKSSLTMALFRINELVSGRILIDGVDISTMPLRTLRSHMSIIPQSPVLFKGTLRAYMDPFDEFSDADIWDALDKVDMKQQVSELDGKLAHELSENGENFSVGERQLLCMARALLTKSRIVVMDEATASIDHATEKKLQAMIDGDFQDATVLTIAHRLTTVLDSDRIMVLSDGKVVEFGAPRELVAREGSVFRELASEGGYLDQLQ